VKINLQFISHPSSRTPCNLSPDLRLRTTGLKVNAKTKYMVMSRDQHAVQNHNIMTGNKSFERVEQLRYLGTTITNKSCIHEEIKSILDAGNACYNSAQNLLSSSLLSKHKNKDNQSCNFACCFAWA
jgi:hypothetical protein